MTTFSLSSITSETTPSTPYISSIVITEHQPNSANMLPSNRKQDYFKQCKRRGEQNKVTSKRSRLKGVV
jgi:hypothetical protein